MRFVAGLDFCTGLSELRKTALHMRSLMEYGLILPAGRLVRPQEIAELGLEVLSYPIETENAARAALAKHDADTVRARLRDFGTFFENGVLYAPRDIKEAHVRFALSLLGIAQELGRGEDGSLSRQALLDDVMSAVQEVAGVKLLTVKAGAVNVKALREMMDDVRSKMPSGVACLVAEDGGKVQMILYVSKDLHDRFTAPVLIRDVAAAIGGSGGGRPDQAQAGGSNAAGIDEAFAILKSKIIG